MKEVSLHVGARIRLYRKAKQMTLLTLSQQIHKSKATLSKYETGDIIVDIETLFDIAKVLGVRVEQLIDFPSTPEEPLTQRPNGSFFPERIIYVYFYDGRVGRVIRNLLEIHPEQPQNMATFYNDLASFDSPEDCRNLYYGPVEYHDTVTNFSLDNQSNQMEHAMLYAVNPFDRGDRVVGLLSGISRYPVLPISIKCVLSPSAIVEDEKLKEMLIFSKKDFKLIRSLNMFAVEQQL